MSAVLAEIPEAEWLETPASVRTLINAQQQLPPSSDGLEFKPPERRKGTGRPACGQQDIPAVGRNCCRLSGWMRWWITTLMPAAAEISCLTVLIQIHCFIR
jgi:hypothetical protein